MDAHNSEYIAPCDERLAFISGFKGTNGIAVITKSAAKLWTDARYYLSAQTQLAKEGCGWEMMKMEEGQPKWFEWVIDTVGQNN